MNRFIYLLVYIVVLPLLVGLFFKVEIYSAKKNRIEDSILSKWVRGFIICLGLVGFLWKDLLNITNINNIRICSCFVLSFVLILYIILKRDKINQAIHSCKKNDWKQYFLVIFLLYFGLCVVEDTAYIDDVSSIMSKGIGESLYSLIEKWTNMKIEKLVLYLFPLMFVFVSYQIVRWLVGIVELDIKEDRYSILLLLMFVFLPLCEPEWNVYSIFGKTYDTKTIFACVFSPLSFLWLLTVLNMIKNKEYNVKKIIKIVFFLFILVGIMNLLQVLKCSVAETSISQENIIYNLKIPNTWEEAIKTTRIALNIYGIGRYNFAIVLFCMFILLYIRDYTQSNVLLALSILIISAFFPPLTIFLIKKFGFQIYSGLLLLIPLPLVCSYTYARVNEKITDKRKKIVVFVLVSVLILWCCYHNFDMWHNPRILIGMKGSD